MSLFAKYVPFKVELEKYISHCKTVFDQIGDKESSALVSGFISDLEKQRYNITIVGSLKRGKSTLLNTLMERSNDDISPIASEVCTSAVIKYLDKAVNASAEQDEKAVIYFNDPEKDPEEIPLNILKDYVTETRNPENRKGVRSVEVYGDFPDWSKAVTIVDSPGQNAVFSYHDVLLSDFLPYTDAIIFLVSADIPLDGGDIALLKELSKDDKKKIFFVLTKIDEIDNPDDLELVKSFVTGEIAKAGVSCNHLYAVSARPVYNAITKGASETEIESLKEANGIRELEEGLEKFIVAQSDQTAVIRSRIETLLKKTAMACNDYIDFSEDILSKNSCDLITLKSEHAELMNANDVLRENADVALRKFSREWDRTISRFKRRYSAKASAIEDRVREQLGKGGLIGTIFQSFKLKQTIGKIFGNELEELTFKLEDELFAVANNLNKEMDEEFTDYIRRKRGTDKGAVAGSLLAMLTMGGTVAAGGTVTHTAVVSALSAFGTYQHLHALALEAVADSSIQSVGLFGKLGSWLFGSDAAAHAANLTAKAANAGTVAITEGITAVATAGVSIVASIIVQKLLQIGLVEWQKTRVTTVSEQIMEEMEDSLFKALTTYKESLIQEYKQEIEDLFNDNKRRMDKITELIENDDPEERARITENVKNARTLLAEGCHVEQQIPLLNCKG